MDYEGAIYKIMEYLCQAKPFCTKIVWAVYTGI